MHDNNIKWVISAQGLCFNDYHLSSLRFINHASQSRKLEFNRKTYGENHIKHNSTDS